MAGELTDSEVELDDEIRSALTFQEYTAKASIDGVSVTPLKKHHSENGWFLELYRLKDGSTEIGAESFPIRQVSVAGAEPNRINAFHIHPKEFQEEIWTVVQGSLMVWLVDCRQGSPTPGLKQRVLLNAESPTLLFIPAGIAHGYKAGGSGAILLYAMNKQFNAANPNEGRLPWSYFGEDLWADDLG